MKDVKVIANYLPQFHRIPENDAWWGEGYTEWVAVKNSKPLYKGHNQPRVPENEHYYRLDDANELRRQAKQAREHGIYGFGIYHYWFSSELHLLDKPVQLLHENPDIDIHYMFIWDNSSWKRTWSNVKFGNDWSSVYGADKSQQQTGSGLLAELRYGDEEEWTKHFEYLLPFFRDSRYIKIDNKPVFGFYNQNNEPEVLAKMCACWDALAKKAGFDGVQCLGKRNNQNINIMDYAFLYQPEWDGWLWHTLPQRLYFRLKQEWSKRTGKPMKYHYDAIWKRILKSAEKCDAQDVFYSGFVAYDDSPRRGQKGRIVTNESPAKLEKYLTQLLRCSAEQDKEFVFLTAWNEWGEGAYLEPDTTHGYAYLQAVKNALQNAAAQE